MGYKILSSIVVVYLSVATALTTGCGSSSTTASSDDGTTTTGNADVVAGWTSDLSKYVVADKDGNTATLSDGVISITPNGGTTVTIYYDTTTGLPTKAVVGDIIFVYEWDTANATVSVAYIDSSGSISLARDIAASASDIAAITSLYSSVSASPDVVPSLSKGFVENVQENPWWYIGKVAGGIGCVSSVGLAYVTAGTSEIVLAGQAIMGTCGLLVVTGAYEATIADDIVEGAAGAPVGALVSFVPDSMGCASLDPTDCVQAVADLHEIATSTADTRVTTVASEVTSATASLKGAGGAVKVTLSWESAVDLDLHVTDPNSEEIYYSHKTSASGGLLDVDDTDGGTAANPAAENIYWDTNAPSGTYTVTVVYYSGSTSNVAYSIIVYIDDVQYGDIHTGTLSYASPSTEVPVTTFTYSGQ